MNPFLTSAEGYFNSLGTRENKTLAFQVAEFLDTHTATIEFDENAQTEFSDLVKTSMREKAPITQEINTT